MTFDEFKKQLRELPMIRNVGLKPILLTVGAIIVLIALFVYFNTNSFSLFSPSGTTTIQIEAPRAGTRVLFDDMQGPTSVSAGEVLTMENMPSGEHQIIAFKQGFWPWSSTVTLKENETRRLHPFLIPRQPAMQRIATSSPEYRKVMTTLQFTAIPDAEDPLASDDDTTELWVRDNEIKLTWATSSDRRPAYFCDNRANCTDTITVTALERDLTDIAFFKNRSDVIMFAAGSGVYVVPARHTTDLLQPLYEGVSPRFYKQSATTTYIADDDQLFRLNMGAAR